MKIKPLDKEIETMTGDAGKGGGKKAVISGQWKYEGGVADSISIRPLDDNHALFSCSLVLPKEVVDSIIYAAELACTPANPDLIVAGGDSAENIRHFMRAIFANNAHMVGVTAEEAAMKERIPYINQLRILALASGLHASGRAFGFERRNEDEV